MQTSPTFIERQLSTHPRWTSDEVHTWYRSASGSNEAPSINESSIRPSVAPAAPRG
jgi:hypothetical protein